jgi:hypothetical protein
MPEAASPRLQQSPLPKKQVGLGLPMGSTESVATKVHARFHAPIPKGSPNLCEEEPASAIPAKSAEKAIDCKFSRTGTTLHWEIDTNSPSGKRL